MKVVNHVQDSLIFWHNGEIWVQISTGASDRRLYIWSTNHIRFALNYIAKCIDFFLHNIMSLHVINVSYTKWLVRKQLHFSLVETEEAAIEAYATFAAVEVKDYSQYPDVALHWCPTHQRWGVSMGWQGKSHQTSHKHKNTKCINHSDNKELYRSPYFDVKLVPRPFSETNSLH